MKNSRYLGEGEIGKILAYHDQGLNANQIAKKVGRHRSTITRFLKNQHNNGQNKRTGRSQALTPRSERLLLRTISKGNISSNKVKSSMNIPLTKRRVNQIISSSPNLKYEKRKPQPKLTKKYQELRIRLY